MRPAVVGCLALASMLVCAGDGRAQKGVADSTSRHQAALVGTVRDSLGEPVAYAAVFLGDGAGIAIANEWGEFHLDHVPAERVQFGVRRIGYAPLDFTIQMPPDSTVGVAVMLHRIAVRLSEVTVEEKRVSMSLYRVGFYDRQRQGWGTFILPTEVWARHATSVAQALYGINGITVAMGRNGSWVHARSEGAGECDINVFIDGQYFRTGHDGLNPINYGDIKAMEIYPRYGTTPVQFQRPQNRCGALVLWTRID